MGNRTLSPSCIRSNVVGGTLRNRLPHFEIYRFRWFQSESAQDEKTSANPLVALRICGNRLDGYSQEN